MMGIVQKPEYDIYWTKQSAFTREILDLLRTH